MIERSEWPAMPALHTEFLERAIERMVDEPGLVGIALGGSFVTDRMDDFSDLDFVLAFDTDHWPEALERRRGLAGDLGPLLDAFTGEHVGEPRLLICLFGPPLLHVDLKFVSLDDVHDRVEDPAIVWERDGALTRAFERSTAVYPMPEAEWLEARFWIWVENTGKKLERGELFEVLNMLAWLRAKVLGPLELSRVGKRPDGVRRLEQHAPVFSSKLAGAVAHLDASSCVAALRTCVDLYSELRTARPEAESAVEREVRAYLAELERQIG